MMDYLVLTGQRLTRLDSANVLPLVLMACQREYKQSASTLNSHILQVNGIVVLLFSCIALVVISGPIILIQKHFLIALYFLKY